MSDPTLPPANTAAAGVAAAAPAPQRAAMANPLAPAAALDGTVPSNGQSWKLYAAAAIGALLLALTDMVRHSEESTVQLLTKTLVQLDGRVTLLIVVLIFTPLLGVIATWIYRPSTERDAFTLGFAVFSLFALVPGEPDKTAISKEIDVSSVGRASGYVMIAPAHAGEAKQSSGVALVTLDFRGTTPSSTAVTVRNLTTEQWLGEFAVADTLKLVGNVGDHIVLELEAPGYERTRIDLTIQEGMREYEVPVARDRTPLFLQRLRLRTAEVEAKPVPGSVETTGTVQ